MVSFEVPIDDIERARRFYTELFDWKIEKAPDETHPFEYWYIKTTPSQGDKDSVSMPMDGVMMKRQDRHQQGIDIYIDVGSIEEYTAKAEKLGGKVIVPKTAVPNRGYFAVCKDTEGNVFALWTKGA